MDRRRRRRRALRSPLENENGIEYQKILYIRSYFIFRYLDFSIALRDRRSIRVNNE